MHNNLEISYALQILDKMELCRWWMLAETVYS